MNLGNTIRLFIDTEFTDFVNCDLISIGLAADNGSEFYGENSDFQREYASEWVQLNIYPLLDFSKHGMKRNELSARLWCWLDELPCTNFIVSVDYQTDYDLLYDLLGEAHPKQLAVQNIFNNMYKYADEQIIAMGGSDTDYQNKVKSLKSQFQLGFMEYFWTTKETQHHALSDAKANRAGYSRLINSFGLPL